MSIHHYVTLDGLKFVVEEDPGLFYYCWWEAGGLMYYYRHFGYRSTQHLSVWIGELDSYTAFLFVDGTHSIHGSSIRARPSLCTVNWECTLVPGLPEVRDFAMLREKIAGLVEGLRAA